jgi:PAS domain S-box-containing protein
MAVQKAAGVTRAVRSELSERLRFVSSVTDGCHLLLEAVLRFDEVDRASVVVRAEDQLMGAAYGVPDEQLQRFLRSRGGEAQQLRDAIDGGAVTRLYPEGDDDSLGFGVATVVPFPGPRGIPMGAVVLEGIMADEIAGLVREIADDAGPRLARIAEVSELRARVHRLEQDLSLLGAMVNSFADPVVLTDRENNFLFANRRAEQLLSNRPDDSEGRRRAIRVNDLMFSSFLTQSVIGGAEKINRELNLVDPNDGSDLLFEVMSVPLPQTLLKEGAVISVLRDITDLKRALTELEVQFTRSRAAERSARQESDRLGVVLSNVGDPILVTDQQSNIILMNSRAERLFEDAAQADEQSGRIVQANDTKFTTLISDFLLQNEGHRIENLVLQDPTSTQELPIEVVSSKITDQRGQLAAIVSILHDLTEVVENERLARELQVLNEGLEERIRLATEELEERNRRLEWQSRELQKASRLKSEFLASMSHELRTPINAMLGYTALLREEIYGKLNEKQEGALRKIYGASQHLLALINDILDLSKIEAGKMPVRIESVRLEAVVAELSQTIEPMVREKRLDYRAEVSEDLPAMETDRTKVKQILLNLLSNAVKFTSEGQVLVRALPVADGKRVRIEVRDTGIGIRQDDMDAIFDDFRQVDQSSTRKYGGTGLGLSITRKLVRLMGGTVEVESEFGKGSVFRVELPAKLDAALLPVIGSLDETLDGQESA